MPCGTVRYGFIVPAETLSEYDGSSLPCVGTTVLLLRAVDGLAIKSLRSNSYMYVPSTSHHICH